MVEVVAETQKEALPQGVGTGSLPSPSSLSLFLPFFFTLSALVSADTGAKDPQPAVTKEAKEPVPYVSAVEAQSGIPQTIQRVESPPAPEGGDMMMEEAPKMTISDPVSGLHLDAKIAAAEVALARAYKVLQDLKVKKQLVLSSSIVIAIPSGDSLLTGLIP